MRLNVSSCLLALALGCTVSAGVIQKVVEQKSSVRLPCPHPAQGSVSWSRERDGHRVDILTLGNDTETKHIPDPSKRYSTEADKSFYIRIVDASDSGTYLCNNEPSVELKVIPSGGSRHIVSERTTVRLQCPPDVGGPHPPTWSRDAGEIHQTRFNVSPVNRTLIITDVQPGDAGLYLCDGKPVVHLTVTKGAETSPTAAASTPTTTTQRQAASERPGTQQPSTSTPALVKTDTTTTQRQAASERPGTQQPSEYSFGLLLAIIVPTLLLLLLLLLLIMIYFTRKHRVKRRGTEETQPVYCEIRNELVIQPSNGGGRFPGSAASRHHTGKSPEMCFGESNHGEATYWNIADPLPGKSKPAELRPNTSPYSLIETFPARNNKDPQVQRS